MRRHGTDFMAIGAILAGATIGAGGTAALLGSGPLDNRSEAAWECESFHVYGAPTRVTWSYSADRHGEVGKRRCPRVGTTYVHVRRPARTIDLEVQAELEALAAALAEARTRAEVVEALEGRAVEARRAAEGLEGLKALEIRTAEVRRAAEALQREIRTAEALEGLKALENLKVQEGRNEKATTDGSSGNR